MIPDPAIRDHLHTRLCRSATRYTVPRSLPVLFFGDLLTAQVATVALNPSNQEYLDRRGNELDGPKRRFETLASLGAIERQHLTPQQCDRATATMREYFQPGKPIYSWLRSLDRVIWGIGYSYEAGEVAHLDLVQEATYPTWSALKDADPVEASALRANDEPFLWWQLQSFPLQAIVCNGRTVFDAVCKLTGVTLMEAGKIELLTWSVASAEMPERTMVSWGGISHWHSPPDWTSKAMPIWGCSFLGIERVWEYSR